MSFNSRVRVLAPVFIMVCLLSACGFQLRGASNLPYETVAVEAFPGSLVVGELRRNLRNGTNAKIVTNKEEAVAIINILSELREKQILTVNRDGRPREYVLRLRLRYDIRDQKGRPFVLPTDIVQQRDISFNEGAVLAKESEEQLLYRDMQSDLVQQLIRRIAVAPAKLQLDE